MKESERLSLVELVRWVEDEQGVYSRAEEKQGEKSGW